MMLLAFIACPRLLVAQEIAPVAPTPAAPLVETPLFVDAPLVEPVNDLPATPGPHIDSITLFPNQGEITSGAKFNDQRFGFVLHGEVRAAYESNIFIQSMNEQEDFIFVISPGVAVGWGEFRSELYGPDSFRHRFERYVGKNYFYLDYSPSYTSYVDHSDLDSFDHDARLAGEWLIKRLTLGVNARYLTQTTTDSDIGNRVEVSRFSAALTSKYDYSGKTSFEVNAFYDSSTYEGNQVDTKEWRNEDWVNYQWTPKIKLSMGGAFGYVERSSEASQTYERALLRARYEASEKLNFSLTGGGEWRQTEGGKDATDGVFQLDATWNPLSSAYLYFQGFRRSVSSGTIDESYYLSTGAQLEYRQQLRQHFYFGLVGGYLNADYNSNVTSGDSGRQDDLYFVRPSLGFDVTAWLNCVISAEYQQNESTVQDRSFEASKATVQFNLLF